MARRRRETKCLRLAPDSRDDPLPHTCCIYTRVNTYINVCIYICVCIYIYLHICIYLYIYRLALYSGDDPLPHIQVFELLVPDSVWAQIKNRPIKETYKRDLSKRPIKETYTRDLHVQGAFAIKT